MPDILENSGQFFFPIFTAEWVIVEDITMNTRPLKIKVDGR